jgi:3-hydroxy-9,10-secoandrosta-1,3,5(10)-triene-9,17-dione monooxygenase reductase component
MTQQQVLASVSSDRLRATMSRWATGVTVITAMHDGQPVGVVANSFTSVSLDPPLVLFCPALTSSTWPRIRAAGSFVVNILGYEQRDMVRNFSRSGGDKFEGVAYSLAGVGAPVLDGVPAYAACEIVEEHAAGDHMIVIGRVVELECSDASGPSPLVFCQGEYLPGTSDRSRS